MAQMWFPPRELIWGSCWLKAHIIRRKRIDGYVVATNVNKVLLHLQDSLIACIISKWTSYSKKKVLEECRLHSKVNNMNGHTAHTSQPTSKLSQRQAPRFPYGWMKEFGAPKYVLPISPHYVWVDHSDRVDWKPSASFQGHPSIHYFSIKVSGQISNWTTIPIWVVGG